MATTWAGSHTKRLARQSLVAKVELIVSTLRFTTYIPLRESMSWKQHEEPGAPSDLLLEAMGL